MPPLPSDGWRSRKVLVGAAVLGVGTAVATVAMFVGDPPIASFDQWASYMQVQVPSVLVPLFGALGLDKLAEAKRPANGGG